jgi:hypothetical protein
LVSVLMRYNCILGCFLMRVGASKHTETSAVLLRLLVFSTVWPRRWFWLGEAL